VTFISIHFIIIYVVLLWRTYEMHPALSLKSGCDGRGICHRQPLMAPTVSSINGEGMWGEEEGRGEGERAPSVLGGKEPRVGRMGLCARARTRPPTWSGEGERVAGGPRVS
jgi:hypothetical protein